MLDHYRSRPTTPHFNSITLLGFTRQYTMPKELGTESKNRSKEVIVTPRPYCSPDPSGPTYEQYCRQSLMQHKPFRDINELKTGFNSFTEAYADFLQSGNIPRSLGLDIFRLQQHFSQTETTTGDEEVCFSISHFMCIVHVYNRFNYNNIIFILRVHKIIINRFNIKEHRMNGC